MDLEDTVKARLELLELAERLGNIRKACTQLGYSRDSFYRFKALFDRGGEQALREMGRNRPNVKNRVAPILERAVLLIAAEHPEWGATRVARYLAEKGNLTISVVGIKGVWARHDLSTIDDRLSAIASGMSTSPSGDRPESSSGSSAPKLDITHLQTEATFLAAGNTSGTSAQNILNGAFSLFAERNYSQVTIKDISEATGLNPSLIYYYYGSKEGLFLKVVETAALKAHDSFRAIATDLTDPMRTISLWIINHAKQFELMQKLIKISIDYANTHNNNAEIDQAIRRFYDIERAILKSAISQGIATNVFRPVETDKVVSFISTYLDGVLVRSVMFSEFDFAQSIEELSEFVIGSVLSNAPDGSPFSLTAPLQAAND